MLDVEGGESMKDLSKHFLKRDQDRLNCKYFCGNKTASSPPVFFLFITIFRKNPDSCDTSIIFSMMEEFRPVFG